MMCNMSCVAPCAEVHVKGTLLYSNKLKNKNQALDL